MTDILMPALSPTMEEGTLARWHVKKLLADAKATEDEIKAIDAEIKAIVAEAVQFAQESPEPDPSELYTDVYLEAAQ